MGSLKTRSRASLLVFALLCQLFTTAPAEAAETMVFNNATGSFNPWNQGTNDLFILKFTGVVGAQITTIKSGWSSGITTQAPNTSVYIFSDVSNSPGSVVATFSYASNDGANWATFTGSYTVPAGGVFWVAQRNATSTINNSGSGLANQISNGWSISLTNRYYGTSLTGPFTNQGAASAPIWQLYTGASAVTLNAPSAPTVSSTSSTIAVSETSTTTNASSYLIRLFASNGTTLIDSKTATNTSILSGTTFTGLSPNTNYKVGVIAIGDGSSYLDSALSALTSVTTALGSSTVSISVVGSPSQLTFRTSYQLRATTTGSTGYVTFNANGKPIAACRKVTVTASTANCNWRPSLHGVITISSTFTSTNANFNSSSAAPLSLRVVARTNTR